MSALGIVVPLIIAVIVLIIVVAIFYKKPPIVVDGVWMLNPADASLMEIQVVFMVTRDESKLTITSHHHSSVKTSNVMTITESGSVLKATYSDPNNSNIMLFEATDSNNATLTNIFTNGGVQTFKLIKK
jgi:hypothetical protein